MTPNTTKPRLYSRKALAFAVVCIVLVTLGIAGGTYYMTTSKYVYIEKASIQAPTIRLAPTTGGTLQHIDVKEGEFVPANTVVAQVGLTLLKTSTAGLITATHGDVGNFIPAGQTVVEMIDPASLRVVGSVQENKGLAEIKPGQVASFTVDAFGSKHYTGIVDAIAPQARSGDVVFSISDKREEQNFDVKIQFDTSKNTELKQGMSAKLWIYK